MWQKFASFYAFTNNFPWKCFLSTRSFNNKWIAKKSFERAANDWIFTFFYLFSRRIYIKVLNQEYKVFYIGTNTGRIYKIVQFIQNGESKSTLLDIFEVAQNEAIQVMQISQKRKSLYVSTDHRIKQIDLAMCSRRYDSCFRCVKDPYCGWDEGTNSCKPYELGLLQVSFMAAYENKKKVEMKKEKYG